MMPDLFGWLLTGCRVGERTNASTTQLLEPRAGTWSDELCQALGIVRGILPTLIEPGNELGSLRASVAEELGLDRRVKVVVPATHDTASAVVAVPANVSNTSAGVPPDWCYLSSGTWSLLGVEAPRPVINAETMRYNFTNEGGVAGTTRLLKNIMGLWLIQECRRTWARAGRGLSYEEMIIRAHAAPAFTSLVDPDDSTFLAPGDMEQWCAAAWKVWHLSIDGPSIAWNLSWARRSRPSTL
jgi:rhamnulokinase